MENRSVVSVGKRIRGLEENTKGHKVTFGGDGYVHYLNCDEGFPGIT